MHRTMYSFTVTEYRNWNAKQWEIIWRHNDHKQLSWQENLTVMEIYLRG